MRVVGRDTLLLSLWQASAVAHAYWSSGGCRGSSDPGGATEWHAIPGRHDQRCGSRIQKPLLTANLHITMNKGGTMN